MQEAATWTILIAQWLSYLMYFATMTLIFRMGYFFFSSRESANWQTIKYKMGYPVIAFLMLGLALQYAPAWIIRQARLGLPAGIREAELLAGELAESMPPLPDFSKDPSPVPGKFTATPDPDDDGGLTSPETILTLGPTTNVVYQVQDGDTLAGIASQYGIGLDELRRLNPQVSGDLIHSGDYLNIAVASTFTPTPEPTVEETATPTPEPTATSTPWPTATPSERDSWGDWSPGDPAPTPIVATPTRGS